MMFYQEFFFMFIGGVLGFIVGILAIRSGIKHGIINGTFFIWYSGQWLLGKKPLEYEEKDLHDSVNYRKVPFKG